MAVKNLVHNPGYIYHLTTPEIWEPSFQKGVYEHPTLKSEGFIHCSTFDQVAKSAAKHFSEHDQLLLLVLVEKRFKEKLKWEPAKSGELFPHIYGKIPLEDIESIRVMMRTAPGEYELD